MASLSIPNPRQVLIAGAAICLLTASSYIAVPIGPVPMTMQTLAVVLVGAGLGPRGGALCVLSWLGLAFAGAPLLAGGGGGPAAFVGPTAGYLAAFPIAAYLSGLLPRPDTWRAAALALAGFLAAHGLILALGTAWLSVFLGAEAAFAAGAAPFFIGAGIKSALAVAVLKAWPRAPRA
ncbi:MAG: biotin transporter BioY [Pseudomonadota bacterium]